MALGEMSDVAPPPEEERERRLARVYCEVMFVSSHAVRCSPRMLAGLLDRELVGVVADLIHLEILGFVKRDSARGWVPLEPIEESI